MININCHTSGNGFDIQFKNGSLTVPDQQKAYIISSGCGSGKTVSIQQLIKYKFHKGIIYCVDTISEVDKMYEWILKNTPIPKTDILRLHGGTNAMDELKAYWENPEEIMKKKIILLTHVRFWTDLIHYFLIYNPTSTPAFDGDFKALMLRDDLRQYIIFDETPNFFKPFFKMSRAVFGCFSEKVSGKWQCKGKAELIDSYSKFISNTSSDFIKKSHKMGRVKRDVILECIPKYWKEWINSKKSELELSFYPRDLCLDVIKTHILIYEGVGEVLLNGSPLFELLNIEDKYNSIVNFTEFPEPQKRRDVYDDSKFNDMINNLVMILNGRKGTETLIVVWKNIGKNTDNEPSGESAWMKQINDALILKGLTPEKHYSITYYGSSNTKSTNDYNQHTGIVLVGDWNIPHTFPASIRKAFVSETSISDYRLWYYVQLISRIGIRNLNKGALFDVYYTSDYKPDFINCLKDYFNNNIYVPKAKIIDKNWLDGRAKENKIRKEQISDIKKLAKGDPELKKCIIAERSYSFTITLDNIYSICPKSRKKKQYYEPLKNALDKLDITMNIS